MVDSINQPSHTSRHRLILFRYSQRKPPNFSIRTFTDEYALMTKESVSHLDVAELKQRGWTESLIKNFLGQHDRIGCVDHYANSSGKRLYCLTRVMKEEKSAEFEAAFIRSAKRRKLETKTIRRMKKSRSASS